MNDPRLTRLIDRYLDGGLSPEEKAEFEGMLRDSEAARRQFWEETGLHQGIHTAQSMGESDSQRTNKVVPFRFAGLLHLAAAGAIGLFVGWLLKPAEDATVGESPQVYVAQMRFAEPGVMPESGQGVLPKGPLELGPGMAEIEFFDGARVAIQGPASIVLKSTSAMVLHAGRLSADVPERAIGFRVMTPAGEIIDLGTRFGVSVGDDGEVEAHVFEGLVDWRGAGGTQARVGEREAIAIGTASEVRQMVARPDTFPETETVFDALLLDGGFENGRDVQPLDIPSRPGIWSGDRAKVVPATNGITPVEGERMMQFVGTANERSSPTRNLRSSEQWQLIDLRVLKKDVIHNEWVAEVSASFNRVSGDERTDTQFSVGLMAFAGDPQDANRAWENRRVEALARVSRGVITDGNPATWQTGRCAMTIPREADYLLLHVNAVENIHNDEAGSEFDGHFVDHIVMNLRRLPVAALALVRN